MSGITTEPKKSVALVKMIPRIYGKPCVMVSRDGPVFVSRRIFGIRIEWAWAEYYLLRARNSWVDPQRARPDSLTAGLRIGNDDLEVGSEWWLDKYFRWWFVFKPECVARSLAGDHSWVEGFLRGRSSATGRKRAGRRRSRT